MPCQLTAKNSEVLFMVKQLSTSIKVILMNLLKLKLLLHNLNTGKYVKYC